MHSTIRNHNNTRAFTLVEIMIVVAIIGLLAALAIPGFVKARKQSQGRRVMNDVRMLDAAIDQWALEKGKKDGDEVDLNEMGTYLKQGFSPGASYYYDVIHNPWVFGQVGTNQVRVSFATVSALAGVGIDWGNYAAPEQGVLGLFE